MKKLVDLLRDLIKTLILGIIAAIGISIVIGLITLIIKKGDIKSVVQVIRSALLIIGSFGLLLSAILIIKKTSEDSLEYIDEWKEKFKVFSYKIVIIFSSITILLCGGIIDWFLFYRL